MSHSKIIFYLIQAACKFAKVCQRTKFSSKLKGTWAFVSGTLEVQVYRVHSPPGTGVEGPVRP